MTKVVEPYTDEELSAMEAVLRDQPWFFENTAPATVSRLLATIEARDEKLAEADLFVSQYLYLTECFDIPEDKRTDVIALHEAITALRDKAAQAEETQARISVLEKKLEQAEGALILIRNGTASALSWAEANTGVPAHDEKLDTLLLSLKTARDEAAGMLTPPVKEGGG